MVKNRIENTIFVENLYLQMLVELCLHLPDFCQDGQELIALK